MDIKSGWLTTEFWGKVAVQLGTIWAAIGQFVPPKYAAIIIPAVEAIYMSWRGILKVVAVIQAAKAGQPVPIDTTVGTQTVVVNK